MKATTVPQGYGYDSGVNLLALGAFLRKQREANNFSRADMSVLARVTTSTLQAIESGDGNPQLDTLERITTALGVTLVDAMAVAIATSDIDTVELAPKIAAPPLQEPSQDADIVADRRPVLSPASLIPIADTIGHLAVLANALAVQIREAVAEAARDARPPRSASGS